MPVTDPLYTHVVAQCLIDKFKPTHFMSSFSFYTVIILGFRVLLRLFLPARATDFVWAGNPLTMLRSAPFLNLGILVSVQHLYCTASLQETYIIV